MDTRPSTNGHNGTHATNGRLPNGRFAVGNPGGSGNPFARRVGALRSAILDAVTAEQMRALFAKLLAMALGGDLAAAALVLRYAVGPPPEKPIDPDDLDGDELKRRAEGMTFADVLALLGKKLPAEALEQARHLAEANAPRLLNLGDQPCSPPTT